MSYASLPFAVDPSLAGGPDFAALALGLVGVPPAVGAIVAVLTALVTARAAIAWTQLTWLPGLSPVPLQQLTATRRRAGLLASGAMVVLLLAGDTRTPQLPPQPLLLPLAMAHAMLAGCLAAMVATDWDSYLIPDVIPLVGGVMGLTLSLVLGPLAPVPLWENWLPLDPAVAVPVRPAWIAAHPRWHAAAVSLAGAVAGLVSVLALRAVASRVLGVEAMGSGDATLMAMAGAYVGWQAVLLALLLAPVLGLVGGLLVATTTGRPFIAFGPWLAAATWLLLCLWRRLWSPTARTLPDLFSDVPVLLGTIACVLGGTAALLLLMRRRDAPAERH